MPSLFRLHATAIFIVVSSFTVARGDVVTVPDVRDNTLYYSADPANQLSNGAGQFFFAGVTDDNLVRRGLVAFDLSAIPAGAAVQNATLTMYFDRSLNFSGMYPVSTYRLKRDWGEGTSDAGGSGSFRGGGTGTFATENDATWLYTFYNATAPASSSAWSNPGAEGDYITTPSALVQINGGQGIPTPYQWTGPGMAADVQYWLDHPGSNFGWLLKGNEASTGTSMRFESRENINDGAGGTIDTHPFLTITYSVPEPVALWSPGLALLALVRRRTACPHQGSSNTDIPASGSQV